MTPRYLRIAFISEFLVAVIAIFTAWSEIGGQATLDIMPWGWKCGLALGLAIAVVAYSAALVSGNSVWNARTSKWLALVIILLLAMGVVTYYYVLQTDLGQPADEQDNSAAALHSGLGSKLPHV